MHPSSPHLQRSRALPRVVPDVQCPAGRVSAEHHLGTVTSVTCPEARVPATHLLPHELRHAGHVAQEAGEGGGNVGHGAVTHAVVRHHLHLRHVSRVTCHV